MSKRDDAEAAVLEAIKSFDNKIYGPSRRDLSEITGFGTGTIQEIVVSLYTQKRIEYTAGVARSIRAIKEEA